MLYLMFYYDGQFPQNVSWLLYSPEGVLYRVPFRYRTDWLHPQIRNGDVNLLKDKKALVVMKFQHLEPKLEGSKNLQIYIPLREVRVVEVRWQGPLLFFYLKVERLVAYDQQGELTQFSARMAAGLGGADSNLLAIEAPPPNPPVPTVAEEDEAAYTNAWIRLATLFTSPFQQQDPLFPRHLFLKLDRIARVGEGTPIRPVSLHESPHDLDRYGYRLRVGNAYTVRVLQLFRIRSPIGTRITFNNFPIILRAPSSAFEVLKDSNTVIGNYDEHHFTLSARNPTRSASLSLVPSTEPSPMVIFDGNKPEPLFVPDITLRFILAPGLWYILVRYVFPILVFLAGSLLNVLAVSTTPDLDPAKLIGIVFGITVTRPGELRVILLACGLLSQGLGLFVFRRTSAE